MIHDAEAGAERGNIREKIKKVKEKTFRYRCQKRSLQGANCRCKYIQFPVCISFPITKTQQERKKHFQLWKGYMRLCGRWNHNAAKNTGMFSFSAVGVYFTFYSAKLSGCILLAVITFGIPLLGRLFQKRSGFLLISLLLEIMVLILAGNVVELIIFMFFTMVLVAAYTIQSAAGKDSFLMEISPVWLLYLLYLLCCYIPLYFTGYPGQLPLQMIGVGYVIL